MEISSSYRVQHLIKGQINVSQWLYKNKASQAAVVKVEVIVVVRAEKSRRLSITLKVAKTTV